MDRSRLVDEFGRRCGGYLAEIASSYDTVGRVLLKASQSIHPDAFAAGPSESCYKSIQVLAKYLRGTAEHFKMRILSRLSSSL